MKYARIQKDEHAWPILVGFKNSVERAEQWIRFGYEFPQGVWENMGYYQARCSGYGMRHWNDGKAKTVELCDGRSFPAILRNDAYRALDKAERDAEGADSLTAGIDEYFSMLTELEHYNGTDGTTPTCDIDDLEALKDIQATIEARLEEIYGGEDHGKDS